jgi:oligopeptidase A
MPIPNHSLASVQWEQWTPDYATKTIQSALKEASSNLERIATQPLSEVSYVSTLEALEQALEIIDSPWSLLTHLESVNHTPELSDAYAALLPAVTAFHTELFHNQSLWERVQHYSKSKEAQTLTDVQKRFLEEIQKDFQENGADLPVTDKATLHAINDQLSLLTHTYAKNVLNATNSWKLEIRDPQQLKGLPQSYQDAAAEAAVKAGYDSKEGPVWLFTLHQPSYVPVLEYLEDEFIRKEIWNAKAVIGSQAPYDNTAVLLEILQLRHQKALLLKKIHFAQLVLSRRMAKTDQVVSNFIETLHSKIKDRFIAEQIALETYAAEEQVKNPEPLEPWSFTYWMKKRKKALYDFDGEALRAYFPLDTVLKGLFTCLKTLFDIRIEQRSTIFQGHIKDTAHDKTKPPIPVWHASVEFYELWDGTSGICLGGFYTDWFPRASKRSGAWMMPLMANARHDRLDTSRDFSVGVVCGNFNAPVGDMPALLSHTEVETLFHEMGHLLHHVLGEVPVKSLNGIHVAWDFVELPSQIMENWCWEKQSLDLIARHYKTHDPLPEALFDKMRASRTYFSAFQTMRQLALAKMDLELHTHPETFKAETLEVQLYDILQNYLPRFKTKPPSIIRAFNHLFSDPLGYAAGYYSYKWAEVLDADAFSRFENEGVLNAQVGSAFRKTILSAGNSQPPEVLFKAFMGRDPDISALLKRSNLS